MGSRLREKPERLFEVFLEVGKPSSDSDDPFILQKYPLDYDDQEVLKSVPKFAFPCNTERYTTTVDHFTFVFTDLESKYRFGFCRHATGAQTCLCIISFLPWFEVFYNFLNSLAEITNKPDDNNVETMLRAAYVHEVPLSGVPVTIVAHQEMFSFTSPDSNKLPSIPASRNLTEYYNAMDTANMVIIFASMLHERRIVVVSKKLSRLTACVHAASALLYPMHWQHLFIPVLPAHLIDYLTAPMPYVIGCHTTLLDKVRNVDLGDAVVVDCDNNSVTTEYDDVEDLPDEISSHLKRHMKGEKVKHSMQGSGDVISKAFMMALVKLIGGYRDALKFNEGETITFNPEAFVQSRPVSMQPFLENMLHLQIFQQFINDRLDMLNTGKGFSDLFESECLLHADKLNTQSRYKEWLGNMKKQGRKMQRGGKDIWSDFKEKAGPVMTNAVESVKVKGKQAYSGFKTKIGDLKKDESPFKSGKSVSSRTPQKNNGGISSKRPATLNGPALVTHRENHKEVRVVKVKPPRPPLPSTKGEETPHRPKIVLNKQLSTERVSRYNIISDSTSHDDTDLMYSRVSMNLLSDPDIQHAMYRSTSAENVRKSDPTMESFDSSSSESDSSSNAEHADVPYIDDHATDQQRETKSKSTFFTYSNLEDDDSTSQTRQNTQRTEQTPTPPPRGRKSPKPDAVIPDRLIKAPEAPPRPPKIPLNKPVLPPPPPPKPNKEEIVVPTDQLLISLDSPESVQTSVPQLSGLSGFKDSSFDDGTDSFHDAVSSPGGPYSSRQKANRRSITRTPAMKLPPEAVARPNIRRERSPLYSQSDSDTDSFVSASSDLLSLDNFDPLAMSHPSGFRTDENNSANTSLNVSNNSDSLMGSWDINQLTPTIGKSNFSMSQSSVGYSSQKDTNFSSQNQSNAGYYSQHSQPSQFSNFTTETVDMRQKKNSPSVPPRPATTYTVLRSPAVFSSPQRTQTGILQPTDANKLEKQPDPFADLVSLEMPAQTPPPKPPPPTMTKPTAQITTELKSNWETFDC